MKKLFEQIEITSPDSWPEKSGKYDTDLGEIYFNRYGNNTEWYEPVNNHARFPKWYLSPLAEEAMSPEEMWKLADKHWEGRKDELLKSGYLTTAYQQGFVDVLEKYSAPVLIRKLEEAYEKLKLKQGLLDTYIKTGESYQQHAEALAKAAEGVLEYPNADENTIVGELLKGLSAALTAYRQDTGKGAENGL